jgi:RNA polymerase sigma-70 factor (ECF subfamily)
MSTAATPIKTEESLAGALSGEAMSGFEGLYKRHYPRVYSICLGMTGNASDAEDLAQEVFILLSRKLPSFRGDSAFTTWLHSLTVNLVLMHLRKRRVKSESVTDPDYVKYLIEGKPADDGEAHAFARIALSVAIPRLPGGYRTIFILHDVEGYEHQEIAKLLGCSAGTSKSQLHKARMKLRRLLEGNK